MRPLNMLFAALTIPIVALSAAGADRLRRDVLAMMPESVGEIAFIDMREVQKSPHYRLMKDRIVPARFADFERFVNRAGVSLDTDVDWLAWGLISGEQTGGEEYFFGVVQGAFSEIDIRNYYTANELATVDHRGQTIYLYGDSESPSAYAMTLLDTSTGLFGTRASIELILDTRDGLEPNITRRQAFSTRIAEVNGRSPVWVVMDDHYAQLALSQLLPDVAEFEEYEAVAQNFRAAKVRLTIGREVNLQLEVQCAQAADAQALAALLQGGLIAQGWQAEEEAPELAVVLSRADVRSVGDSLRLSILAREDELRALLSQNIKLFP